LKITAKGAAERTVGLGKTFLEAPCRRNGNFPPR